MKTNCSHPNYDAYQHKLLPALYAITFIFGVITNGWGLYSMLKKWKKLGNVNVFVLNLELANILYLPTLPFLTFFYLRKDWIFGDAFCKVIRFCFNLNLYCSIGFLTCISVYRYLGIVHPVRVKGRLTVTHSVTISVLVWLFVSLQSLPDIFFAKTFRNSTGVYENKTGKCYHTTSNDLVEDYLKYSLGQTFIGFFIPFLITCGCYGQIVLVLWRTNTIEKSLKQRSLRLLFILIFLFSFCYIPYHVFKNLTIYSRVLRQKNLCRKWDSGVYLSHQITRGIVCLNSALSPLAYLHVGRDIIAQNRQLLQRVHLMFHRQLKPNPVTVPQAEEV